MPQDLPLKRIHHLELVVGNAKQAAYFYRRALGFDLIAYKGPETGHRRRASYALRQGRIALVLTTPLEPEDPYNVFLNLHGDSVKDICFEVEDVDKVFQLACERGARDFEEPSDLADPAGRVRRASIRAYGDTIHSFVAKGAYDGTFLPGFESRELPGETAGLLRVDHVVGNVEDHQMERWVDWYSRIFGFERFVSYDDKDISTEYSALRSTVVASPNRQIKFPINEPAEGRIRSQIQEYIDYHVKAGVQHIAMLTGDICASVRRLRENGVEFLDFPMGYYDRVWDRVGEIKEDPKEIEELGILVDRDDKGYLLQLFTKPVEDRPTLFIEIIQRRGSESFGKGNFRALFETIEQEQRKRGNL
jgi:4-hydroxyphenylpyruvate dioxygenase